MLELLQFVALTMSTNCNGHSLRDYVNSQLVYSLSHSLLPSLPIFENKEGVTCGTCADVRDEQRGTLLMTSTSITDSGDYKTTL